MNKRHHQILAFCLSLILIQTVCAPSSGVRTQGVQSAAARPLTPQGLDNLVAFTRLLGYVRHFYPGDEAATTNWDAFAVAGIQIAETAETPSDLAHKLETLFHPVAQQTMPTNWRFSKLCGA